MWEVGIEPSAFSVSRLLSIYARLNKPAKAIALYNHLVKSGTRLDAAVYSCLMANASPERVRSLFKVIFILISRFFGSRVVYMGLGYASFWC